MTAGDGEALAQLRSFVRAAEAGSFSAAARAQGTSPSAVSKLIARLEHRLCLRLFERQASRVELTPEGRAYLPEARAVLEALAAADATAEALAEGVRGSLRIHTLPTFAKYQLAPHLPEFMERWPELELAFELESHYVDRFDHGVDVAIHSGALPDSSRVATVLMESRWIVCAAPAYLARHGSPASPQELDRHRCLNFMPASDWARWPFQVEGRGVRHTTASRVVSNQGDLLRDLALAGAGIVRLAEFHIGADLAAGRLVPVLAAHADPRAEAVRFICSARRHQSPRIRAFKQFLLEKLGRAGA